MLAAVVMAASVLAQSLPRLPADIVLPQSGDSPGKVTFSHANHVGFQAKPDCTACHPKLAPILKAPKNARRASTSRPATPGCRRGRVAHCAWVSTISRGTCSRGSPR